MLANAILSVTLIALITMAFLSAGLTMTRMTIQRVAQTYVSAGFQRANAALQAVLAADLRAGSIPSPMPTITPLALQCVDATCHYLTGASFRFTATLATPGPCEVSATNCAINEEANSYVGESRFAARITVVVTDAGRHPLVTRSHDVLLRTLSVPPYVVVAGARDETLGLAAAGTSGDDGGLLTGTPNPCASPGTITQGTSIQVAYQNAQTNACTDGSSWRADSYWQQAAAPPGWSP